MQKVMPNAYVGVDPGKSGGISCLPCDINGNVIHEKIKAVKMPETERDVWEHFRHLKLDEFRDYNLKGAIEKVFAMPKQGVSSTFKFGTNYGFLRGMLIALEIPFIDVTARKWQRTLCCLSGGNKNVTKAKAQELFPGIKRITHAIADSLLIAEYARLMDK